MTAVMIYDRQTQLWKVRQNLQHELVPYITGDLSKIDATSIRMMLFDILHMQEHLEASLGRQDDGSANL